MKIQVDGREIEVGHIRVGELCQAEKLLQVNMGDGSGAAIAVTLFVGFRREDKTTSAALLADQVMRADVSTFEEVEEDGPPAEAPAAEENGAGKTGLENPLTSGPRPLAPSA